MLKLRKVELLGFKSFCEKTPITFSGSGITCIVGPNGCGKSNVVDAISWVLGQQSHKMLRAERMADCIFNGTAKRPPMGLAEVNLTLVDPELSDAVAKVIEARDEDASKNPDSAQESASTDLQLVPPAEEESANNAAPPSLAEELADRSSGGKRRASQKPAVTLKPGEVVVSRRLYRSGQSEYLINGRVARLRDIQEIFMGIGLGPDSYAIIEQGRIGQILNSKPMDRRAIIEEAAGITMFKTKKRLSEAKLEASKLNLSRVNDILVEVEKQLGSLKRQASKARRYAELREQMRGLLRVMLASKAEHLDIEAARLQNLLREMDAVDQRESQAVHELEAEQERLNARTYELDGELRHTQNVLNQTDLDLQLAENRIIFNREKAAEIDSRAAVLSLEAEKAERESAELVARASGQREAVVTLREQTRSLEAALHESTEHASADATTQEQLERRVEELRQLATRLTEESLREQAESEKSEQEVARYASEEEQHHAKLLSVEVECTALSERVQSFDAAHEESQRLANELELTVRTCQDRIAGLRREHQETAQQVERTRESLSSARARHASIEQILSERAYTADAVQKLFGRNPQALAADEVAHPATDFRAVGLLADYAEVQEQYEAAVEQFLRDELEYVVVESFDHARTGVSLLRDEMGGRATFFVDSLSKLNLPVIENEAELTLPAGVIARLDRLVDFRDPLGPAAKQFLARLRSAYLVDSASIAERMAQEDTQSYFLTPDGTCYHGRLVSGGRAGDAGPLALKRELRQHESESSRLAQIAQDQQTKLATLEGEITAAEREHSLALSRHIEAQKALVSAIHQREQAHVEWQRVYQQISKENEEIARLHARAAAARSRAEGAREKQTAAVNSRIAAEAEVCEASERLSRLRHDLQVYQERVAARRIELAAISERLTAAEATEARIVAEIAQAAQRAESLRQQHDDLLRQKIELEAACEQGARQAEDLRREKARLEENKAGLDREWEAARSRAGHIDESLRTRRQSLDEMRAQRSQHQVEKARNDADREYLRQTCITELNAQPEELMALMAQEAQLLIGENLIAAEANYSEMKTRVDAMGAINMMALEEFQDCEQREAFLRRERDDLVESIQNTQLTINELDQVSRQKFDEAFNFINAHFAIAFQSLFGGGTGEMRLSEPDSSGEAGIDIVAQPPGKRLQNILLLSGGEKALTALALLIAVFRFQPSPFCILDEVDAPLDEANVGRFNKMLRDMCAQTQFIVVTHNRRTMEMGSVLYGVTMQEPGVSKLVSVKWEDAEQASAPKAQSASNAA